MRKLILIVVLIIFTSCSNKELDIIYEGDWGVRELKLGETYLIGGDSDFYIFKAFSINKRHNKFFIDLGEGNNLQGDFQISKKKSLYYFNILNCNNPVFNGEYTLNYKLVKKGVKSNHYEMILVSENIFILSEKILIHSII